MTNISTIENKITAIAQYLKILESFKKHPRKIIEEDFNIRGALERYLYLATQATIDLSDAVVSIKNFRKPTSLREGFDILHEENVITVELREKMVNMAGFRNVVAHDYAKINYDTVYDVLQNKLTDIEEFVLAVKKYLDL